MRYYNRNENKLFADAMLQWAKLSGFKDVMEKDEIISFSENSFSPRSAENSLLIPPDWNEYFQKKQNQFISRVKEMRQEKGKKVAVYNRAIEGTFNRKKAIANDYIHFFAPGDEIFDCIVDNAVRSCRGQSAAYAMKSNINWIGFVFTWSLYPNEKLLIDANVSLSFLSSFRNYLAVERVQIPVSTWAEEETPDSVVISEYNRILQKGIEKSKDEIEHLGKRGRSDGFLGIYNKYKCSNVDYFKVKNPQDIWEDTVKRARNISKNKAIKLLISRSHVADAKAEMERILTSIIAKAKFFGQEPESYDDLKNAYDIVLESLNKPIVRLESACYVQMVKK